MNTKQTILAIVIFMTSFLGFSDKTYAENTTGTVNYNVWYDQNEKVLILSCQWTDNQSFIEPEVYWDENPNTYGSGWKFGKVYGLQGEVIHKVKVNPCTVYFTKLVFKDWTTGNNYSVERTQQTQGDKTPTVRSFNFEKIGYTYALLGLNVDGNCNGSTIEVSMNAVGELPTKVYTDGFYNSQVFTVPLYGLKPNTRYEVGVKVFNQVGSTNSSWMFITESNLLPFTESLKSYPNPFSSLKNLEMNVMANIDPKNTYSTEARIECSKDITLEAATPWLPVRDKGTFTFGLDGIEYNTLYYWRSVVQNEFGRFNGEIKIFKVNSSTSGIQELTFDDLLRVSKSSEGILINVEQKAEVRILSINGQIMGTYNVTDKLDINNLPAGIYLAETTIGGKHLVKKFMF